MTPSPLLTLALSLALVGLAVYATRALVLTLVHMRRLRRALLVWTAPSGWRKTLAPIALTFASGTALMVLALDGGSAQSVFFALAFSVVGLIWIAAARLSSLVVVTPVGLLVDINRPHSMLRWTAVEDYFEGSPTPWHYGFFYYDARGQRQRLTIEVPRRLRPPFEELLRVALRDRIERSLPAAVRRQAPSW
jgi:hypothetical protein